MDLVVLALMRFTEEYCSGIGKGQKAPVFMYLLPAVDIIQILANPVFGHSFNVEPVDVQGRPYYRLIPFLGQTVHRVIDYFLFFGIVIIFIIATLRAAKIFRERYSVILVSMVVVVMWETFYIFSRTPVDRSMIGFGVCGLLIYYFSMHYRPLKLLDRMLSNIVTDMSDYLYVYDSMGKCIWANETGMKFIDLHDEDYDKVPEQLEKIFGERKHTHDGWSGNRVIDGFTGIREVNTAERMLLVGIRTGFSGEKLNGVYTMEGEELMPPIETPIASVTEGYAVLEEDGKFGLYSFAERRQILPCRYDQLITNPNGVDDYVMNGYVAVEVDGKRYYADIYNDGALSEPIDDTGRGFAQYGCVYAWRQEARSVLMAADGFTQTTRHAYLDSRGDGYLLVYQMDSYYGVMTWHGRDVLNTYTKCIVLTDDGKMICDTTRHGYQLLELTQDDRRALPAEP